VGIIVISVNGADRHQKIRSVLAIAHTYLNGAPWVKRIVRHHRSFGLEAVKKIMAV
jgi:hypothetical protein